MADTFFQQWLDRVGDAFFSDRFEIFRAAIRLPLEITSEDGGRTITDTDGLQAQFDMWMDMMKTQRVTDMIRVAHNVQWMSPDMICGDYYTELLSNGQRIMDRFQSSMILEKRNDSWLATHVATGITRDIWPPILPN